MKQIYLATPFSKYTDPNARVEQILDKMAEITKNNRCYVVSAIMYYPLLVARLPELKEEPFDWWYETSKMLVLSSDEVWYWNEDGILSTGCDIELECANTHGVPIRFI